jgi:hypothetical protein
MEGSLEVSTWTTEEIKPMPWSGALLEKAVHSFSGFQEITVIL